MHISILSIASNLKDLVPSVKQNKNFTSYCRWIESLLSAEKDLCHILKLHYNTFNKCQIEWGIFYDRTDKYIIKHHRVDSMWNC